MALMLSGQNNLQSRAVGLYRNVSVKLFASVTFKMAIKNYFFPLVFGILLFEATFTSFSKDKKSKRSYKTEGIKFFLLYFCLMKAGSGSATLGEPIALLQKRSSRVL